MSQEQAQSKDDKLTKVESAFEPSTATDNNEASESPVRRLKFGKSGKSSDSKSEGDDSAEDGKERPRVAAIKSASDTTESEASDHPRRRGSLTERLHQRKAAEAEAPAAERKASVEETVRRRPAGPPPKRLAPPANDDLPSIGGLIFALQQKPSRTPFLIAAAASAVWFIIGGIFSYSLLSSSAPAGGPNVSALAAVSSILVPIAIFWFLALLVWRAQELRLMASAMTEVAVRLAEPDRLAEQSVASLGQVIRRQVAAMNDGISRAIGRASELEALVHNEVAALERSYGDNETRVRALIAELASEREALANNSERVSRALKGIGEDVARDIAVATSEIDKSLAERGLQLTELLVARSNEAAAEVYRVQDAIAARLPTLLQSIGKEQKSLTQLIDSAVANLTALEASVGERTAAFDGSVKQNLQAFDASMKQNFAAFDGTLKQNYSAFDGAMKQNFSSFDGAMKQHFGAFDGAMQERMTRFEGNLSQGIAALANSLAERITTLESLVGQGAAMIDKTLAERTKALGITIDRGAQTLVKTLQDGTEVFAVAADESATGLEAALKTRTDAFTSAINAGAVALDKTLAERTGNFTNSLAERSRVLDSTITGHLTQFDQTLATRAGQVVQTIGEHLSQFDQTLASRSGQVMQTISEHLTQFDHTLANRSGQVVQTVTESRQAIENTINEHMNRLDEALTTRGREVLDGLAERRRALEEAISTHTAHLDRTLATRSEEVMRDLAQRLKAIDTTFQQRSVEVDRVLTSHVRGAEDIFGKQTAHLHKVLADNANALKDTAHIVGQQSGQAVDVLSKQTETLRQVSGNLLQQIHNLTQRFENQGQGILSAAQALETSNTKIDSILESRHQAIIGLLHTVNTRAQDLDGQLKGYVGAIQTAMADAEARAKQATQLLARDTSNQAQQGLALIDKMRTDAQAHAMRAIEEMKSNFAKVISQIGQQMEQMRGQFDSTSRGVREAARQTANELEALRREMQTRMDALPQHTAQATAAIRKALSEQIAEIEAITPVLTRTATQTIEREASAYRRPAPQIESGLGYATNGSGYGASAYTGNGLDDEQLADASPLRGEAIPPLPDYDYSPLPQVDDFGRPASGASADDIGAVASNLAQQLSGASSYAERSYSAAEPVPQQRQRARKPQAAPSDGQGGAQGQRRRGNGAARRANGAAGGMSLRLDELARAIDPRTAAEAWERLRAGEQGVLSRGLYTSEGQPTFDEVSRRYEQDAEFRGTVDRYMTDFERLLGEAEQADPDGTMLNNYLVSETGRVYLLLAHASNRLR